MLRLQFELISEASSLAASHLSQIFGLCSALSPSAGLRLLPEPKQRLLKAELTLGYIKKEKEKQTLSKCAFTPERSDAGARL